MKNFFKKALKHFDVSFFRGSVIPMDFRQIKNVRVYSGIWETVRNVSGNIVECGVGKGRSLLILGCLAHEEGRGRKVWGFDSFEGFPEVSLKDESERKPKKGDWSGTTLGDIAAILRRGGLKDALEKKRNFLVKGFFSESLSFYSGEPIGLLHVDCDLYESYKVVLETMYPFVSDGGVILFDEYGEKKWPGAKRAVDEFLENNPHKLYQEPYAGKYYIVKGVLK